MPFIDDKRESLGRFVELGSEPTEYSHEETRGAAFRIENEIGSFLSRESGLPGTTKTGEYDAWEYMTEEEKIDSDFVDYAKYAESEYELEATRRQFARERRDREILRNGGFWEVLGVSLASPVNLIPFSAGYRSYKTGGSILESGVVTSVASAGGVGVSEALLHHSQIERTYGESAVNVTAGALLGGILGMTPAGLKRLFSKKDLEDIERTLNPEARINNGENSTFGDGSIGAAEVMNDAEMRGTFARAVAKATAFDPLTRTITSDSSAARSVVNKLAENPLDMDAPLGTSVESLVKAKSDGRYFKGIEGHEAAWKEYKQSGGELKRREFNEAVGKAQRNGSDNPYIQRAADSWERNAISPTREDAIKAKLLPEDVQVKTAKNYLHRMWSREKILADPDAFIKKTMAWLDDGELSEAELRDLATDIMGRISSTPDGRLPYDYKLGESNSLPTKLKNKLSGSLKERTFDVPDKDFEEFLENDIELVMGRYLNSITPDIELKRAFGEVDLASAIKGVQDEYLGKMAKMKPGSGELRKTKKKMDSDIEDIAAMRDRIRGQYKVADAENPWVRAGRVARDLNYMRLLGGVVAASIPDAARVIAAEGISKTFSKGLVPLVRNIKAFKASAREAKIYGVGTDALMGGRAELIADIADYTRGKTAFERGIHTAAQKFSSINLMNQWTSAIKQLHVVTMQTRVLDDLKKGVYDKRLGQLGISEADAKNIYRQAKKYGSKKDGAWIAHSEQWDSRELADMWGAALRKESDRVVIMPGQEKPLFMSSELGKTIFQFKTFMFSATQRIFFSTLQAQEKHMLQGVISLVSLGMMSYVFKQWDANREISDDPAVWVMEGIDRSGMLGIFMEWNNSLEKISGNRLGLRPLSGIDIPASRYASRSVLDSALGPTFGLAGVGVDVLSAAVGEREWDDKDTRALRRLAPGQNLSIFRQAIDKMEGR